MTNSSENTLWDLLSCVSRKIESQMDTLNRKRTGSYYTDLSLTDVMMSELVSQLKDDVKPIYEYRFLEPCVGVGNFVFSYLKAINNIGLEKYQAEILLDNIYVADINQLALEQYKISLRTLADQFWNIMLPDEYFDSHIGTGLLVDISDSELSYIPIESVFDESVVKNGFDIVATNPPYKNLKAERSQYATDSEFESDKSKYQQVSKIVADNFSLSTNGVLNLYKLFVEEIIDKYSSPQAYISLLIPASILSDKTCNKLRSHILTDTKLISVKVIGEGSGYVDAQQALSALLIHKGDSTEVVNLTGDFIMHPNNSVDISIDDIRDPNTCNSIFALTKEEYAVLHKLKEFPIVKDLDYIVNQRGELDLTNNKNYITTTKTDYPLIRGRNISYYSLDSTEGNEFVISEFVSLTKKRCYIEQSRIICQQIANMHKDRRVTFALAPKNVVLGNSCNFISVKSNSEGIDVYTLLGLFNTKIINWFFKLTSSNNHVNNYEIDCFPIPIGSPELRRISLLTKRFLETHDELLIDEIEHSALRAYGLEEEKRTEMTANNIVSEFLSAINHILPDMRYNDAEDIIKYKKSIAIYLKELTALDKKIVQAMTDKYQALYHGRVLNHTDFKLSALDMEMVRAVPQGGSWKNIPRETVEKSRRLKKITQTGGRTTLYGRIDYDKPSYTITTYFNRPGNGTYIHPIHDRVISVREAARFQSFQDDYYFFGNKSQQLKQVGNAVPVLLAYQIGKTIKEKTGCYKSVDLFCGAGGMTAGFKAAGITSLLSTDIDESACVTLKTNNPEIPILCGDITSLEIKKRIAETAKKGAADIICGGPPCQGFSLAGFRSEQDPRNQLFRDFVDVVNQVNPKIIVFENVEGLLSFQGGKTYKEVHTLFSQLGYNTEGRLLMANEYAVPQKRKRVIIICVRNDVGISPSHLFPVPITVNPAKQVTARDTISDLENVPCGEDTHYVAVQDSDIVSFFKGKMSFDDFLNVRKSFSILQLEFEDQTGQLYFGT